MNEQFIECPQCGDTVIESDMREVGVCWECDYLPECFLCNSTENVRQYTHYEYGELVYSDICNQCMEGNK